MGAQHIIGKTGGNLLEVDSAGRITAVVVSGALGDVGAVELEVGATVSAAANNQTLAGISAKRTYITGFYVDGLGATSGSIIAVTITGLANTLTFKLSIPAGATLALAPLRVNFPRPIAASADNTAIVVNVPSFGTGNTESIAGAYGFQSVVATAVELEVGATVGAAAANNQTLAGAAGKRTYITGFFIDGLGATAAGIIAVTITGLANTLTFKVPIVIGATAAIVPLRFNFPRPIAASADATAIVVNVPSFGAGNTESIAGAYGFQL